MLANKVDTSFTVSRESNIENIMIILFAIGQPFAGKLHLINFYSFFLNIELQHLLKII